MIDYFQSECSLCPRSCGVVRSRGQTGFCGQNDTMKIASALIHHGEEPPVSGSGGSGAVFFTGCTLGCFYCQNYQISSQGVGDFVSVDEFADICLRLEAAGAENVNLITGTHFIPLLVEGLRRAGERGLTLPIVWNSSGFENPDALSMIDPFVDIYLPDYKTSDAETAKLLFEREDYSSAVLETLDFMTVGKPLQFREEGLVRGVIIRHLVLPGLIESTKKVLSVFAERYKEKALLSLMFQYRPVRQISGPLKKSFRSVSRVCREEYEQVCVWLDDFGIEEGYIQEFEGAEDDEWTPDFEKTKPFSSSKARVIWDYR